MSREGQAGGLPWADRARGWLGRVCAPWMPQRYVARLLDAYYVDQEPATAFQRSLRDELTRRYYDRPDAVRRADNRVLFWGANAAVRWHEERRRTYQDRRRFETEYLASRRLILGQIERLLEHYPCLDSVCEIGTGSGLMADYLAGHLAGIGRFQAIDLSAEQIRRNRAASAGSSVEFLHVEAADYVERFARPGTLFLAFGTFECFTQAELEEFLSQARRSVDPVAIASCDAVDVDYDPSVETGSRPRGNMLYNHNYRYLMEKHGYETHFCEIESPKPIYNRLSILAASFPTPAVKAHSQTSR